MKYSFWLLGKCDDSNPSAIPLQQLKQWRNEGLIKYLGEKMIREKSLQKAPALSFQVATKKIFKEFY